MWGRWHQAWLDKARQSGHLGHHEILGLAQVMALARLERGLQGPHLGQTLVFSCGSWIHFASTWCGGLGWLETALENSKLVVVYHKGICRVATTLDGLTLARHSRSYRG